MVVIGIEAAQQAPVQGIVGAEPVGAWLLVCDLAVPIQVSYPACRNAYLANVEDCFFSEIAYSGRVQHDPGSQACQRAVRAFVYFDITSGVAKGQRGCKPAQGAAH